MNIVQLTPGAGAMYCGNCLRDNALVATLRSMGHQALMIPLYLPLTLDEPDESANVPVFFGGISVFLQQKYSWFAGAPQWLRNLLSSRSLLRMAAGSAAKTQAKEVGDLTLSMLQGEEGKQARELEDLIVWLKTQPKPDVICLSNALLLGSARRLQQELQAPVVCMLQGEDSFLDSLPEPQRNACWKTLGERALELPMLISPSRYFGELMFHRLGLPLEKLRVVFNGIRLQGYDGKSVQSGTGTASEAPVLGYFARMCREKGLDTLVDAFISIHKRNQFPSLRLKIGGSCGPSDELVVEEMKQRLDKAGALPKVEFHPNLSREQKVDFLKSLTVFSVPASYGEAFGLYVIEALAAGVPVVQPNAAAFPEIISSTQGGLLFEPGNPQALADAIESLIRDPEKAKALGHAGRRSVFENFSAEAMANRMLQAWTQALPMMSARDKAGILK